MKIDINHIFRSLTIAVSVAAVVGVSFFIANQTLALKAQEAKSAALHDCAMTSKVRYESNGQNSNEPAQVTELPAENIYTKCVADKGYTLAK